MVFNRLRGVPVLVLLTVFLLSPAVARAGWDQLDSGVVDDLYDIHFVSNSTEDSLTKIGETFTGLDRDRLQLVHRNAQVD